MSASKRAAIVAAAVYTGASLAAAAAFMLVTVLTGGHGWVARAGGAAWVFLLSMIILMPVVIPRVKRTVQR